MTDTPEAIMLFAAGFGTRMGALTRTRPKPLIPVAGRPLIDHALDLTDALRPRRVVANLHYLAISCQKMVMPSIQYLSITVLTADPISL